MKRPHERIRGKRILACPECPKKINLLDESDTDSEFVDNDESKKSISRNKFLEYKKNNFTLMHNKYNEQTI